MGICNSDNNTGLIVKIVTSDIKKIGICRNANAVDKKGKVLNGLIFLPQ